MTERVITAGDNPALRDHFDLLCTLYNLQALELVSRET